MIKTFTITYTSGSQPSRVISRMNGVTVTGYFSFFEFVFTWKKRGIG